ncbi:hypothetical protein DY000_02003996 [Brassica cretica]|uniref:Uncharacterized protein n=1 Tax=Brassica cretica TaxID=69181 RepID=A0ABQ7C6L6_BRACR|nr:hypothetical protein DY000_02003996 [Brassica cretica]
MVSIRNSPLFVVWSFRDSDCYKFGGVRWELATPETTREVPASEATRRTSPSSDSHRWLRTERSLIGKELLDIDVGLLHIRQVEVQEDSPNPVGAGVAKDVLDVFWVFGQLMQTGLISWFDCDPPDPVWHGAF